MKNEWRRDAGGYLLCRHGHRLHLACEHCESSDRETIRDLNFYKDAAWVLCCALGIAVGVILFLL